MLNQLLIFLLNTFLGLFILVLLLRFLVQAMRAPTRNPMYGFLAAVTDWIVLPARRVIPGLWRTDLSTLVLAWAFQVVLLAATIALRGADVGIAALLLIAVIDIVKLLLYILLFATIAQAILSWIAPQSPAMPILNSVTRPFLGPFQRRIPTVGNVDLSPIFLIVVIQILIFLLEYIMAMLFSL
ncbi:MAG: YggT family protein [Burkholderiales bacterium]|nr:YggT family protein [Burkholderiales bacterium]